MLFTGAPFAAYQIALGAAILRSSVEVFPRWLGYLNLFVSVFMVEASLIIFFKTGPFSQDGVLVFYLPMVVFFTWICLMSWQVHRVLRLEEAAERGANAEVRGAQADGPSERATVSA